jgi:hypothetical protein
MNVHRSMCRRISVAIHSVPNIIPSNPHPFISLGLSLYFILCYLPTLLYYQLAALLCVTCTLLYGRVVVMHQPTARRAI